MVSNSQASFVPRGLAEYRFSLVVNDGVYDSSPDEIRVLVTNLPPIASAGFGQSLSAIPPMVMLDGSHSLDPEGAALDLSLAADPRADGAVVERLAFARGLRACG